MPSSRLARSHCFFPTYSTFEFGPCCLDQHSNLALQQIRCKSVLDWSSVQYSSNLARASGVAGRLATQQIGGVSGRPCSLAEMAIPALAIVVARRHATTHAVLNLLQLEWTSTEHLSTSTSITSSRYASGLVHEEQYQGRTGFHNLCLSSSRLAGLVVAFLRRHAAGRRLGLVQHGPPGRLAGSRVVRRLLDF